MDAGQRNYVSLLNEHAQRKGLCVRFELVNTDGPEHIKKFTMRAVVNNQFYPDGVGNNKKEAKQNAAKNAFDALQNEESVNTETYPQPIASRGSSPITQANYVCWLNEHSHKKRLSFTTKETTRRNSGSNIQYVCGDKEFPEAVANNKKQAKEAAAKKVFDSLTEQEKAQVFDENAYGEEPPNIQTLTIQHTTTDNENTSAEKNCIGLLNEYCQKNKQLFNFKSVDRRGPAHVPEFVYKVIISNKEYPEGRGKTAKEAQKKAAQHAWSMIHDSESSSQISSPSSSESTDEVYLPQKSSKINNTSDSVVFENATSEPQPENLDVKPKRQLAPNFKNSPATNTKEQANNNVLKMAKPSTKSATASSQSTKSRFREEFDSISKIGSGGFGRVFKARRKLDEMTYAVKIVKFNEKARREVSALSLLSHPNIVRYHTSWTEEAEYKDTEASETYSNSSSGSGSTFLYIQMEYCEGKTLRNWIEERNHNPDQYPERRQDAEHTIKQVLEAVKYVHSKKLIHRDLKPQNIMFRQEGGVKVGDFGLVTKEEEEDDGILLERTKKVGTRSYMSPEQKVKQVYDRKVDIYAMGLIYFELLWQIGAYRQERQQIWNDIRSKKFPEGFKNQFDFEHKHIERMLCEDPEGRPDACDLLTELERHSTTRAYIKNIKKVDKENRTY